MTVASRPIVAVHCGPGGALALAPLLSALRSWCDVRAWQPGLPDVVGVVVVDRDPPPGLGAVPVGVWTPGRIEVAGSVVAVPQPGIHADRYRPVPPFVRERARRRHGRPPSGRWPVESAPALGVTGDGERLVRVLEAMACATPVAVAAELAERVGAVDGEHVVVAADGDVAAGVARLEADPMLAARVSRGARRLIESRHDLGRPAAELARRFGVRSPGGAPGRVRELAAALGTPPMARPLVRAETLVSELT